MRINLWTWGVALVGVGQVSAPSPAEEGTAKRASLPSVQEVVKSKRDLWGEAALRQPGGPSYEFFKDLLPPLRYVNTAFRHYPIVLGTPAGVHKIRYVSNGSAVNARADKKPMWRELGFPVSTISSHPERRNFLRNPSPQPRTGCGSLPDYRNSRAG